MSEQTGFFGYDAIVLAGGAGRRFGGRKLLAPWHGAPLLCAALRTAIAAPVDRVIVVTGSDAEAVMAAIHDFGQSNGCTMRLRYVHAADYAEGMAASLRAGIAAMPASVRGCFLFLGDMPRVPVNIAPRLLEALTSHAGKAAAPVFEGRRGHPVLLTRELFPQLSELHGDEGARRVLDALGPSFVPVPVRDEGVLFDIDEPHQIPAN